MKTELLIDPKRVERKLLQFIRNEFKKRGFKKAIIGLSGGVDSSLVAFLLKKALGGKNVLALFLPYRTIDRVSKRDFKKVVEDLGIESRTISITPMIDCYFKQFPKADRIRRGNKMTRERMSILYDQSKPEDALVVGSGNKTEMLLGYTTIFGDSACAISPIGNLYKTQVRQLARYVGVPERIIEKPPTAGLWPAQTDEGELGFSYDQIDEILYLLVDRRYKPSQLIRKGFAQSSVRKILGRVEKFRYKRELPAIAKL